MPDEVRIPAIIILFIGLITSDVALLGFTMRTEGMAWAFLSVIYLIFPVNVVTLIVFLLSNKKCGKE